MINLFKRSSRTKNLRWKLIAISTGLLSFARSLTAEPTVNTLGGGFTQYNPNFYGYADGNTLQQAQFHTPSGIALDVSGNDLLVADRDNNAIRILDLGAGKTLTFAVTDTNSLNKPIGVALDSSDNVFVLNYGNGNNGNVVEFDNFGDLLVTNISGLTNAGGIALGQAGDFYVSASNNLFHVVGTTVTTVATITNAGSSLAGIVVKSDGLIAACDSGNNGIWLIDPTVPNSYTALTGFHGAGDFTPIGTDAASSSTAKFNQPMGIGVTGDGTLIVADYGNNRVKAIVPTYGVTNLYGVTSNDWVLGSPPVYPGWYDGTVIYPDEPGDVEARLPNGIAIAQDGTVYVTEDYYHIIRHVSNTGFQPPPPLPPPAPTALRVTAGYGEVSLSWTASAGATNYNIERFTNSGGPYAIDGTTASTSFVDTNNIHDGTTYYYVITAQNAGGKSVSSAEASATPLFSLPPTISHIAATNGSVSLEWSISTGAKSYNVKRSTTSGSEVTITNVSSTSYTDTTVVNGTTYYYVISAVNLGGDGTNSLEVSATPPLPPVTAPQIGYVDFSTTNTSVFHAVNTGNSPSFNNDMPIVIVGASGTETFYTYGATSENIPDPTSSSASAPSGYQDGLTPDQVNLYTVAQILPDLTIKAIGEKSDGSSNSPIVQARFQFIAANPIIVGNNAASFFVTNITVGAQMWYTTDGSDPTNDGSGTSVGPIPSGQTISLNSSGTGNIVFKVRAFRDNYQPSAIITSLFAATNFVPNSISFGFASGEASSSFVSSGGGYFFAPVTLSVLPNQQIYSLQFNLTVTNVNPSTPPVNHFVPLTFQSMLVKPDTAHPGFYIHIPPAMFLGYATNSIIVTNVMVDTNSIPFVTNVTYTTNLAPYIPSPPSTNNTFLYGGQPFVGLLITNVSAGLMGVGWLERKGETNLYDTTAQDLIKYSLPHDDLFPNPKNPNGVVLGAYGFYLPGVAAGNQYQIQIGRPSATSDGVGAPGSSVFINTPTNGSLGAGAINSIKIVTVVNGLGYIAGDCAPFRWINAGDFGDTNLDNSDVEQVFQSAIYNLNTPPLGSAFFDSMDSCGNLGTLTAQGYYVPPIFPYTNGYVQGGLTNLFDGNDTSINQIAFGDGQLDVCDVYVTFRRSLDPSLVWWRRFWTNGQFAAMPVPNVTPQGQVKSADQPMAQPYGTIPSTNAPQVNFAVDGTNIFQGSAGQALQIPITAQVFGAYPLRVLMLNLSVTPLDGSPVLTTAVQFTPNPQLGQPTMTSQADDGNYGAAWLNTGIAGFTGNVTLGTLTVTIPANANSLSSYAIHFDHASASPNGLASFPKQTTTGLITLSDRSTSSYNDGIPDSWRLRYFGSVNNLLSVSNADADGDGMNNWQEYVAGTDPTDPDSCLYLTPLQNQNRSIYWPSVTGKQYVIQRSTTLFPANWFPISTNIGTGTTMEFDDPTGGNTYFYRVQVQ
jgi:NHL repeat